MTTIEERRDNLTRAIQGKRCLRCGGEPSVAWIDGDWQLRCNCHPEPPKLEPQPHPQGERLGLMVRRDQEQRGGAITVSGNELPMTPAEFDSRINLVKHVVAQMENGIHFGIIPGTKDKSLWEPGAEYLRAAFRIPWDYEMLEEREDFVEGDFYYKVRAFCRDAEGRQISAWTASAWSQESKFRGFSKADLPHNVRDRAIKRAFVALIRNISGTTGYFKEAAEEGEERTARPSKREPKQGNSPSYRFFEGAKSLGYDPKQALGALGVKDVTEIGDIDQALKDLREMAGKS